ncbi:hypothetical protein GFM44_32790 [Rhizobium leguminosarum bv. viciae]|nr:hypothetical protein [Rhizobium leguminosarum bv. viciae]
MADDKDQTGQGGAKQTADPSVFVNFNGTEYYPLNSAGSGKNPCAGKDNGTSCGPGCICYGGQCHYTIERLQELGVGFDK